MVISGLTAREKNIMVTVVIFIISALFYNFMFEPGLRKWKAMDAEIADKRSEIKKYLSVVNRKDYIIKEYNSCAGPLKSISSVLSHIEKQAGSFRIRTSNIKSNQVIDKRFYRECDIELQIEGEMGDIIKFLSEILKMPNRAVLKKFHFSLVSQGPSVFKGTIILSKIII